MAPLYMFPYNKQVLVICSHLPSGHFGSLTTFCWWRSQGSTYSKTQIPIVNQTTSKIKFCSFNLLGVLAMDCFLEIVVKYSKSLHHTYKSPSHIFCGPTNGSLLPNIQLILGIMHQWTSFLSFWQQVTSISPKEFNKPCMLFFSKWSKVIERG